MTETSGGNKEHKFCAFTGHRKIKSEHLVGLRNLLERAVGYAYSTGVRTFFSGGAVGFDILAAREVLRFRVSHPDVRLVMLLPCLMQDAYWSDRQRDDYEYVLKNADETVYVSEEYTPDCMKRRNAELVNRSDMLIAYVSHRRSGSGQTLNFAERAGITVYNLYPTLESGGR